MFKCFSLPSSWKHGSHDVLPSTVSSIWYTLKKNTCWLWKWIFCSLLFWKLTCWLLCSLYVSFWAARRRHLPIPYLISAWISWLRTLRSSVQQDKMEHCVCKNLEYSHRKWLTDYFRPWPFMVKNNINIGNKVCAVNWHWILKCYCGHLIIFLAITEKAKWAWFQEKKCIYLCLPCHFCVFWNKHFFF